MTLQEMLMYLSQTQFKMCLFYSPKISFLETKNLIFLSSIYSNTPFLFFFFLNTPF